MRLHIEGGQRPALADAAELDLVTAYCGGFMSEGEVRAFEERLAEDEAFFDRVAPLLKAWHSEVPPPPVTRTGGRWREMSPNRRRVAYVAGVLLTAAAVAFAAIRLSSRPAETKPQSVAVDSGPVKHSTVDSAVVADTAVAIGARVRNGRD